VASPHVAKVFEGQLDPLAVDMPPDATWGVKVEAVDAACGDRREELIEKVEDGVLLTGVWLR
jgi:hypothetical protein